MLTKLDLEPIEENCKEQAESQVSLPVRSQTARQLKNNVWLQVEWSARRPILRQFLDDFLKQFKQLEARLKELR